MSQKLDLLLVNAGGFRKKVYQNLSENFSAIEPPFWAALTAGYIRNKNFNVQILDANAENLSMKETSQRIDYLNPSLTNIVAYGQHPSASTALMPAIGNLCSEIKQKNPERKIILTGLHPSALPKKTIEEENCDFVGQGEGFYTILNLLQKKKLSKIPGLWYVDGKSTKSNPMSQNIFDLDSELSDVAWDLLPMDKYVAHNWHCFGDLESRTSYASISTTLGCPFNCSFCCINAPFGKPDHREWSPEWTLNQIDTLVKKYDIKNLKIIDELFVLNPNHFMAIAEGLIERDYNLNIWSYARVDTAKEKYLDTLKKAGFNWLGIGIESGDEDVRLNVNKGRFKHSTIKDTINKIKEHEINVAANYIFGLSEDNLESMQKTLDLSKELNCEWANFYCAMAYPGSKLYLESKEKGIFLPEDKGGPGWIGYSQHSYETLPLPTKNLSSKKVLEFRDNAFENYFTDSKYLNMIEKKFGMRTRKHIQNMTKIKLKRKLLGD